MDVTARLLEEEIHLPGDCFSESELNALVLDGVLQHVFGRVFLAMGVKDGPVARAGCAGALIDPSTTHFWCVGLLTAVWIYGAGPPRDVPDFFVSPEHAPPRLPVPHAVHWHRGQPRPQDVGYFGSVPVTLPERTAMDVALHSPEQEALAALEGMALLVDIPAVMLKIARLTRVPNKRRAMLRLEKVLKSRPLPPEQPLPTAGRRPQVR